MSWLEKVCIKRWKRKLSDKYSRSNLNFGHTFGHTLEAYYKYNNKLTHGEAISIGMIIAAKISYKLNYLSLKKLNKSKSILSLINFQSFIKKCLIKKFLK